MPHKENWAEGWTGVWTHNGASGHWKADEWQLEHEIRDWQTLPELWSPQKVCKFKEYSFASRLRDPVTGAAAVAS